MAELYHLANDPGERHNLINDPRYARQLSQLKTELAALLRKTRAAPGPDCRLDEGIKTQLPEHSIR